MIAVFGTLSSNQVSNLVEMKNEVDIVGKKIMKRIEKCEETTSVMTREEMEIMRNYLDGLFQSLVGFVEMRLQILSEDQKGQMDELAQKFEEKMAKLVTGEMEKAVKRIETNNKVGFFTEAVKNQVRRAESRNWSESSLGSVFQSSLSSSASTSTPNSSASTSTPIPSASTSTSNLSASTSTLGSVFQSGSSSSASTSTPFSSASTSTPILTARGSAAAATSSAGGGKAEKMRHRVNKAKKVLRDATESFDWSKTGAKPKVPSVKATLKKKE